MLNKSYQKEEYQSFEQHIHNHVLCFTDMETEDGTPDDILGDEKINVEEQVLLPMFFEQLFDVLEPEEKDIIKMFYLEGYGMAELQEEFGTDYMTVYRKRNRALKKMRDQLAKMGYHNSAEVFGK